MRWHRTLPRGHLLRDAVSLQSLPITPHPKSSRPLPSPERAARHSFVRGNSHSCLAPAASEERAWRVKTTMSLCVSDNDWKAARLET